MLSGTRLTKSLNVGDIFCTGNLATLGMSKTGKIGLRRKICFMHEFWQANVPKDMSKKSNFLVTKLDFLLMSSELATLQTHEQKIQCFRDNWGLFTHVF